MFKKRKLTTIEYIVFGAILSAIAAMLLIFQLPYPPVPYLKIDLSDVIVLIATAINPLLGIIVMIFKILIAFMFGVLVDPIGILSLIAGSLIIIITYPILTKIKTNMIVKLSIIAVITIIVQLLLNTFVVIPFYSGISFTEAINDGFLNYLLSIIVVYLPFNVVKMFIVCLAYYLINKVLERV